MSKPTSRAGKGTKLEGVQIHEIVVDDCLNWLKKRESKSVSTTICSPPYAAQRDLGIGWNLKGEEWVEWAKVRFLECLRVTRGMVCWVIEGAGMQSMHYTSEPILLHADLVRMGIKMCKPAIYGRYSLPGRFKVLRNNWEFIICAVGDPKTAWIDPTATGEPPKFAPGGRTRPRRKDGGRNISETDYKPPEKVNVGNIFWCGAVGGGHMGDELSNENEAPYPEWLAEQMVQIYCPPDGIVLDVFGGSGTTAAMAKKHGRSSISIELRKEQAAVIQKRLLKVKTLESSNE